MSSTIKKYRNNVFGLDLLDQLAFYGAYHNHPINQLIHVIFVPTLLFTAEVGLSYAGEALHFSVLFPNGSPIVITWSFLLYAFYAIFYSLLDWKVGISWSVVMYYGMLSSVKPFVSHIGKGDAWKVALAMHIFSWYMQIHLGHGVCEKRKPALLDSFFQSIVMAPLFVWYETLFFFGYDKEFKKELDDKVRERIAKWKKTKKDA